MTEPKGPVFEGSIEEFAVTEGGETYRLLYLPDKKNEDLQKEGKAPHYYWMPKDVRIATDTKGDYKFHLLHFVGRRTESGHVGVEGEEEEAGGVLSLTTTAAPPADVLEKSHEKLRAKFKGDDDKYWGWRSPAAPKFGAMPIGSSTTSISNLSPKSDGSVPGASGLAGEASGGAGDGGGGGGRATPTPDGGNPGRGSSAGYEAGEYEAGEYEAGESGAAGYESPGAARAGRPVGGEMEPEEEPEPEERTGPVRRLVESPQTISRAEAAQRSELDAWYANLEGEGPSSIDVGGENAFTGFLGSIPTAILWQGFRGRYSPVSVSRSMDIRVWSESVKLTIVGDWRNVYDHFSAHAKGRYLWASGDVKAELNRMMTEGTIEVELEIDGTVPGADEHEEAIQKRLDLVLKKFMERAEEMIFQPPEKEEAAEASGGGGFLGLWGAGLALKARRDVQDLELRYEESVDERYFLSHTISSSLEGFYDEIKADPAAEDKYFSTLYLDDWERKVTRIVKPVVNWPDPAKDWVGDPVEFLSCDIGYPDTQGDLSWTGKVFDRNDTSAWEPAFTRKNADDVENPPEGWEPDVTYVKRTVHLEEPPGETDYPHMRVFVEKNTIDLDSGENGTAVNDVTHEIRADSVGKLEVGPVFLDVELENDKQYVEVDFRAKGQTHEGNDRPWVRLSWHHDDQNEPRYWEIFTGQLDFVPEFEYRVRVVVKGTIFTSGMEWTGPVVDTSGNGPLMVSVPTREEAVPDSRRALTPGEAAAPGVVPRRGEAAAEARAAGARKRARTSLPQAPAARGAGEVPERYEAEAPEGRPTLGERAAGRSGERRELDLVAGWHVDAE